MGGLLLFYSSTPLTYFHHQSATILVAPSTNPHPALRSAKAPRQGGSRSASLRLKRREDQTIRTPSSAFSSDSLAGCAYQYVYQSKCLKSHSSIGSRSPKTGGLVSSSMGRSCCLRRSKRQLCFFRVSSPILWPTTYVIIEIGIMHCN